jgi:hypothetical protein
MRGARAAGIDPGARRRAERYARGDTLEAVGREWFEKVSVGWADSHLEKIIRRLELYLFPWVGRRPIAKLSASSQIAARLAMVERTRAFATGVKACQQGLLQFRGDDLCIYRARKRDRNGYSGSRVVTAGHEQFHH